VTAEASARRRIHVAPIFSFSALRFPKLSFQRFSVSAFVLGGKFGFFRRAKQYTFFANPSMFAAGHSSYVRIKSANTHANANANANVNANANEFNRHHRPAMPDR
jgi:hypothetical protein